MMFLAWVYLGVGSCPWSLIGDTAFAGELSVLSRTAIYTNIASFLVILMTTINGTCTSAVKSMLCVNLKRSFSFLAGMKRFYFPIICISSQFACVSSSAILVEILKSPEAFSKNLWVFEIYRSSISKVFCHKIRLTLNRLDRVHVCLSW